VFPAVTKRRYPFSEITSGEAFSHRKVESERRKGLQRESGVGVAGRRLWQQAAESIEASIGGELHAVAAILVQVRRSKLGEVAITNQAAVFKTVDQQGGIISRHFCFKRSVLRRSW
jgi:hypothetical protein